MNSVILIGNLTRDPDFRESGNGVCKFSLAIEDGYGDNRTVSYPSIVVFGNSAKSCATYLEKGSKVCVQGRIQTGSYERDGQKHYTTDVIANKVEFLSTPHKKAVRDENRASEGYSQVSYDDVPF
jgi:single-strand DNA-binding protein